MKKDNFKKMLLALTLILCLFPAFTNAQENGIPGTLTVGSNSYLYYKYGDLYWMVSNSKEGTPDGTSYTGKLDGENGYYYSAVNKNSACPAGWRLPTWDEATALKTIIDVDRTATDVKWWTNDAEGAYAGINSGSWVNWGIQGVWRLSNNSSTSSIYNTMTSNSSVTPAVFTVDAGSSKTPRWYSVRCVKSVLTTSVENQIISSIKTYYNGQNIVLSGFEKSDIGSHVSIYTLQGINIVNANINTVGEISIPLKLQSGIYLVALSGNRNLTVKVQK